MRIKQISVYGLFGIFDHVIPLSTHEKITIIHGPNGFGKTAVLRLVNSFFNSRYSDLRAIPFGTFEIKFDNNTGVEVVKTQEKKSTSRDNLKFTFRDLDSEAIQQFSPKLTKISSDLDVSPRALEAFVPGLERMNNNRWMYLPTNEMLSLDEVFDRFFEILPPQLKSHSEEPEWLRNLKENIHVRLIESQRLLNIVPSRSSKAYRETSSMISTVSAYSEELARLMQDKFKEYGTTSQSLDRTFPIRVVKQQPTSDVTDEQLRQQLNQLEKTRARLIEVGLLDKDDSSESQIQPQDIDESTKNALSVYIGDVEKKLSVFSEVARKIDLLRRIINTKFAYSYKEINFSKDQGFVFTTHYQSSLSESKQLLPNALSSGEQHELVLLYELLFKVKPNSLVLIDEPELSLHVGWQTQFLKDLQEITKLADLDVLMATHSPDIIQDQWDLTVELKGPEQ